MVAELFGLVEVRFEERDLGGSPILTIGQREMNFAEDSLGGSPAVRPALEVHFV